MQIMEGHLIIFNVDQLTEADWNRQRNQEVNANA